MMKLFKKIYFHTKYFFNYFYKKYTEKIPPFDDCLKECLILEKEKLNLFDIMVKILLNKNENYMNNFYNELYYFKEKTNQQNLLLKKK